MENLTCHERLLQKSTADAEMLIARLRATKQLKTWLK